MEHKNNFTWEENIFIAYPWIKIPDLNRPNAKVACIFGKNLTKTGWFIHVYITSIMLSIFIGYYCLVAILNVKHDRWKSLVYNYNRL